MISPFIGAIVEKCCGTGEISPVSKLHNKYVHPTHFTFSRHIVPGWKDEDHVCIQTMITSFKFTVREMFAMYQQYMMNMSK